MATISSLLKIMVVACLLIQLCYVPSPVDSMLKKKDWIRVGQCMLDCKQINTTCFQYCVTSAQQRRLTNYTGRTAENMWNFPKPGVKINWNLTENNIVYPYPESDTAEITDTAKIAETSDPAFVFLLLSESEEKDIWLCKGWSTTTSMTIRHEEICDNSLLGISAQGLIVDENLHCKIRDIAIDHIEF